MLDDFIEIVFGGLVKGEIAQTGHFQKPEERNETFREAIKNAIPRFQWKNIFYLIDKCPTLKDHVGLVCFPQFRFAMKQDTRSVFAISRMDKDQVLDIVKGKRQMILFANKSLRCDKDIDMAAVKQSYIAREYVDDSFLRIFMAASKHKEFSIWHVPESLRKDKDFVFQTDYSVSTIAATINII